MLLVVVINNSKVKMMIAYTYLIGWTAHDKWYYGVKFAKGCSIADLWTKYFTSSNRVKKFRKEFGEPDIVEIRRVFLDKKAAQNWEIRFLRRVGAVKSKRWLNANDTFTYDFVATPEMIARRGVAIKKAWDSYSAEKRREISVKRTARWVEEFVKLDAVKRENFIAAARTRVDKYNSLPLDVRVKNAKSGQLALQAVLSEMTPVERGEYDARCAEAKRAGFAAMTDEDKTSWSAAKQLAWEAKSDETKSAFRALCADKRKDWHARADVAVKDTMRARMSAAKIGKKSTMSAEERAARGRKISETKQRLRLERLNT